MDAAAKTKREQQIVGALAVMLLVALAMQIKWRAPQPAPGLAPMPGGLELPDVGRSIHGFRDRLDSMQESIAHPPKGEAALTPIVYTAEGLRDPLISLLPKPAEQPAESSGPVQAIPLVPGRPGSMAQSQQSLGPPRVTIQGVIFGTSRPQAIIDRRVYGIGDEIQGAKIVAIEHGSVLFKMQDQFFRLGVPDVRMAGGER